MRSPLLDGPLVEVDEVPSTQTVVAEGVRAGNGPGAVLALHQTEGRGRFDRVWLSEPGASLNLSMAMRGYADHPEPWLVGMALAIAAAGALHCRLRWPNDLSLDGRKLGGILTEIVEDPQGRRIPVVGIGVNLNQRSFPAEIADRAISLVQHREGTYAARSVADAILARLEDMPEPTEWRALETAWCLFDDTSGKRYTLPDGREAVGLGVGPHGELLCAVDGESLTVMAGDALFGP